MKYPVVYVKIAMITLSRDFYHKGVVHMKVLVVGANGQIGKQLTHLLQDHEGYTVRAMVRKEEQATHIKSPE